MRKSICVTIAVLTLTVFSVGMALGGEWKSVNKYKKIHKEGYANSIFATKAIDKGKERKYKLKNKFTKPEAVYARCYFPGKVGKIKPGDFWHEIWVDRKLKKRIKFNEPPDPDWDQIQIWITEDEYSNVMKALGPGKHEVIIWVIKNVYKGKKAVAGQTASGKIKAEMKEIWIPKRLSKGKFIYVVK